MADSETPPEPEPTPEKPARKKKAAKKKPSARKVAGKKTAKKAEEPEPAKVDAEPYDASSDEGRVLDAKPPAAEGNSAWAMACHLATLVTFLTPLGNLGGILAPILIWQTVGKDDARIESCAREAFNFQVNVLFWFVVGTALTLTCILAPIGIVLVLGSALGNIVLTILAAVKTANGEDYRYPWTYRVLGEPRPQPA